MVEANVIIRLVNFVSAMLAFGTAAFRLYVPGIAPGLDRRLAQVIRIAAVVAFAASLGLVSTTAADMAGSAAEGIDPSTLRIVMLATQFGATWRWHLGFVAALVVAAIWRRGPISGGIVLVLAALGLASLAFIGHAADTPGLPGLGRELNQSLHLLAGGAWLGGLLPLYLLLRETEPGDPVIKDGVAHFSQIGYVAVALIAVTGTINSWILVGSVGALFGTPYGRLLSVKIALYLVMVGLALGNRLLLAPRIGRDAAATAALARSVVAEQALGFAILAVVSVLGTWPPAAMNHAM